MRELKVGFDGWYFWNEELRLLIQEIVCDGEVVGLHGERIRDYEQVEMNCIRLGEDYYKIMGQDGDLLSLKKL